MLRSSCLLAAVGLVAGSTCKNEMDCQLNGACIDGKCRCDVMWTGDDCGSLDVDPEPTAIAYGHGGLEANISSWGGGPPVFDKKSGKYHLFVTEIAGNCGMCMWSSMSTSVRAVSDKIEGPYKRVGVVLPTQSHNTYYAYSPPDAMHLIYTIGAANSPHSCNPGYSCTSGVTPKCTGIRPPSGAPPNNCTGDTNGPHVHYSASLDGPWESGGALKVNTTGMPAAAGSSNPAPYIFPNGTVLMMGRGKDALPGHRVQHNIFVYRADSWNGTYQWVPSNGVAGAAGVGNGKILTEDPTLYRGRRGFHVLLHSHPNMTHGWSEDGINWHWSPRVIGPPGMASDNERPRVALDENGDIEVLFVAREVGKLDGAQTAAFKPRARAERRE